MSFDFTGITKENRLEFEKLRYSAMQKARSAMAQQLDNHFQSWSTLALAGLLALGVSEQHTLGGLTLCLWIAATLCFAISCLFIHKAIKESYRQFRLETDNFFTPHDLEADEKDSKRIKRLNSAYLWLFFVGVALAFALVLLLITSSACLP